VATVSAPLTVGHFLVVGWGTPTGSLLGELRKLYALLVDSSQERKEESNARAARPRPTRPPEKRRSPNRLSFLTFAIITTLTVAQIVLWVPEGKGGNAKAPPRWSEPAYAAATPNDSVRRELTREQMNSGLALVTVADGRMYFAVFSKQKLVTVRDLKVTNMADAIAITRDGSALAANIPTPREVTSPRTILGIMHLDGTEVREYPQVRAPRDLCWSSNNSKLAVGSWARATGSGVEPAGLGILDLGSGNIQDIGVQGYLTSQCFSPDGKQIVYSDFHNMYTKDPEGSVYVLDLAERKSRELAIGVQATWSPDGSWIAFYHQGAYYAISPSGSGKRKLFQKKGAITALWWSPDSRIVAFESPPGSFEGPWISDVEVYSLRARRLEDGSETLVAITGGSAGYQWVTSPEFIPK
jgi:WD40 repeat protein